MREPSGPLAGQLSGNVLSFSLAGDGEIGLDLVAKKPGPGLDLDHGTTSFPLSRLPGANPPKPARETLAVLAPAGQCQWVRGTGPRLSTVRMAKTLCAVSTAGTARISSSRIFS